MAIPFCFRGPNDGARWEFAAQEGAGLRHDQFGLEILPAKRRRIQVGKGYRYSRYGIYGSQRRRVARLVGARLKCMVSVGPMLMRIRRTSTLLALWAIEG